MLLNLVNSVKMITGFLLLSCLDMTEEYIANPLLMLPNLFQE